MNLSDGVEFDMPVRLLGRLAGDSQFDGMTRRYRINRAAMEKAIAWPGLRLSAEDIYDEFWFEILMRVRHEAWRKAPIGGIVFLGPEDINLVLQ